MSNGWEIAYVKRVLAKTGLAPTALAKKVGIAVSTLTRALNDPDHQFRLSISTLERIKAATMIDYSPEQLGKEIAPVDQAAQLVPVYDVAASAGYGSVVEGETILYNMGFDQQFLRQMTPAKPSELAIIRVRGHSMEPTLNDDDQVMVDRSKRNLSYDGLFVLRFDDALHVKRIGRSAQRGHVLVISDHPAYPTLDMPAAEIDVIGRILWVGRKV